MDNQMHIVFADDDADDRDFFCTALKEFDPDIVCHYFQDGYQTLAFLRDSKNVVPDYIFLDFGMPMMSGKQCLQEIRKDERLKDIPVIIYTTSDDVDASIDLTESGATHFVTKPENPEEIYYLISMVLTEKWT